MRNLEHVMNDHERLFDAWADGGVDGLATAPELAGNLRGALAPRAGE